MSKKVMVTEYHSYGKGDGEENYDQYVITDTKEEREEVIDNLYYDDSFDSKEDFINARTDYFNYNRYGGDWDEPTGGAVVIESRGQMEKEAASVYNAEMRKINLLFGEA